MNCDQLCYMQQTEANDLTAWLSIDRLRKNIRIHQTCVIHRHFLNNKLRLALDLPVVYKSCKRNDGVCTVWHTI